MSQGIARQKRLFTLPDSPKEKPALLGGRCSCGHVFFPPHRFGCDRCGAPPEEIEIAKLEARGVLTCFAVAHRQSRPDGDTPLVVGTVSLDSGPAVEVMLDVRDADALSVGQRVEGRLLEGRRDDAGRTRFEFAFAPEGSS
jgi:uncharacterized OB-fold protein